MSEIESNVQTLPVLDAEVGYISLQVDAVEEQLVLEAIISSEGVETAKEQLVLEAILNSEEVLVEEEKVCD